MKVFASRLITSLGVFASMRNCALRSIAVKRMNKEYKKNDLGSRSGLRKSDITCSTARSNKLTLSLFAFSMHRCVPPNK